MDPSGLLKLSSRIGSYSCGASLTAAGEYWAGVRLVGPVSRVLIVGPC